MALTFDQVVEEYDYYVESLLLGYGIPPTEFDDLKQEVWLRVHLTAMLENQRPPGEKGAKFSTRLWLVVRSVAANYRERVIAKDRHKVVPWAKQLEQTLGDGWSGATGFAHAAARGDQAARF